MKKDNHLINKELRLRGRIFKILNRSFSESRFRMTNKILKKGVLKIKDSTIDFSEDEVILIGGARMRVCIFRPLTLQTPVPGVLWLHGGGYATGTPEQAWPRAKSLMQAHPCVVISPEYRVSLDAPYPAAFEDSYAALRWMKAHAQDLGIRDDQIMVGGDSAGGGLAAALALCARDQQDVAIAFQMPIYPMLDDRMETESAQNNDMPVWNSKSNALAWRLYLAGLFGTDSVPSYAAPARANRYEDLPPTVTFVGDLEPFRDETIQYVERLRKAGVPVDFKIFEGCYHGFDVACPDAQVSKDAILFLQASFKYAAEYYFARQKDHRYT